MEKDPIEKTVIDPKDSIEKKSSILTIKVIYCFDVVCKSSIENYR